MTVEADPRCGQREDASKLWRQWYGDKVCRDAGFVEKSSMRTTLSQTWVTILYPLGMVEDLGRSLQPQHEEILFSVVPRRVRVSVGGPLLLVAGRGTKKEANFFSVSHVLETPRGDWNSDVAVLGIRELKSDQ